MILFFVFVNVPSLVSLPPLLMLIVELLVSVPVLMSVLRRLIVLVFVSVPLFVNGSKTTALLCRVNFEFASVYSWSSPRMLPRDGSL